MTDKRLITSRQFKKWQLKQDHVGKTDTNNFFLDEEVGILYLKKAISVVQPSR